MMEASDGEGFPTGCSVGWLEMTFKTEEYTDVGRYTYYVLLNGSVILTKNGSMAGPFVLICCVAALRSNSIKSVFLSS